MTSILSRTLKFKLPMMQGDDVLALQRALADHHILELEDADGLFGPGTKRAVARFQRKVRQGVDGVAGRQIFRALGLDDAAPNDGIAEAPEGLENQPPKPDAEGKRLIPPSWMPGARMKRIILHWTGGSHTPAPNERNHYHILIDGDGAVHKGKHPINANAHPINLSSYAAHTKGTNTGSIGVSLCAMGGDAREYPFKPGPFPITRAQWDALARVAAELCLRYEIPVERKTVLGHGEVQDILGKSQNAKWDPMVVPWDVGRPYREVGDDIRARTETILKELRNPAPLAPISDTEPEVPPATAITVNGEAVKAAAFDGRDWVDLSHLAEIMGWSAPLVDLSTLSASFSDPETGLLRFAITQMPESPSFDRNWVEVTEVSDRMGLALRRDAEGHAHLEEMPGDETTRVIVRSGQTLSKIAQQHLGDADRWRELRKEDGTFFDEESARDLKIGQVVLLPDGVTSVPDASPGTALTAKAIDAVAEKIAKFEGGSTSLRATRSASVKAILKACTSHKVNDLSHQAYILATAYHETNLGQFMRELWGPTPAQKKYGSRLGNRGDADGKLYLGRGFVQITGRDNYIKYGKIFGKDFEGNPQQVEEPDVAAEILVRGMAEIGFTGKGLLADMGFDGDFDWFRARSLINGDKSHGGDSRYPGLTKGEGIARKGRKYREFIAIA